MKPRARQPSLFGEVEPPPEPGMATRALPGEAPDLIALAAQMPADVRFGTSSWSFSGWTGLVYSRPRTAQWLAREGLREYARHALFGTVGVDRSYYAPIPESDLRRYGEQLPGGFPCCLKAPATVTSAILPESARAGQPLKNPLFLSAEHFIAEVLAPCDRAFRGHAGPFVVEFPPVPRAMRLEPSEFLERLDAFLSRLPRDFSYAIELRDRRLLVPSYARILARHGAAHVYNYWSAMPAMASQAAIVAPAAARFVMARLLMRPGTRYEDQREAFRPFNRLVEPDAGMRGEVVALLDAAVRAKQPAFVLVNNKAEGSAPLTIRALVEQFVSRRRHASPERPEAAGSWRKAT